MNPGAPSDSEPAAIPAPAVDFNGKWRSELGSSIVLKVEADGTVQGIYQRAVGPDSTVEDFPLLGFVSGTLLCFAANLGKYGSVISWVGQCTEEDRDPIIRAMWLLERYVADPDDPANLGGATVTGYNHFVR